MKKIIYLIFAAIGLLMVYSCDLDMVPDERMELDSENKVKKLLIKAYPESIGTLAMEMRSDNVDEHQTPNYTARSITQEEYYLWLPETAGSGNDGSERIWQKCYHAIACANAALEAIESMGDLSSMSKYKAEAKLCRAYGHFVLATIFCMPYGTNSDTDLGVPYSKQSETVVAPHYERGTLSELYANINADIEEALPYIDDTAYDVPGYHFNTKAAYAFATRFNLYYQQWDKVIEYSTRALGPNPLNNLRDWEAHAKLSSNGLHRPDDFINVENPATFLVQACMSSYPRIYYTTKYCHHRVISNNETLHSSGPWGTYKELKVGPISLSNPNPTIITRKPAEYFQYTDLAAGSGYIYCVLAVLNGDETILSRAEAYIHKKEYEKALEDLNMFMFNYTNARNSATINSINSFYGDKMNYYTPNAPTPKKEFNADFPIEDGTQENLLHFTLHMRRILTLHEGLRMNDVNRYGITIYRRVIDTNNQIAEVTDKMEKRDPRRALQLPNSVISAGMQPNPNK